ncbi:MAG TPA: hypothetical protein VIV55_10015 [Flavobacterium sp.]
MKVIDDFLPKPLFKELQQYCTENEFQIVQAGEKQFSVLAVPQEIYQLLELPGYEIIFTFIRNAYKDFDNEERIHCDGIIMNKKTSKAAVLYINDSQGVSENGTKFYSHEKYGRFLPDDTDDKEFDRLIIEDSADKTKWTQTRWVKSKPNRLLRYNARYFHGKYPAKIRKGTRIVLVVFYSKLN